MHITSSIGMYYYLHVTTDKIPHVTQTEDTMIFAWTSVASRSGNVGIGARKRNRITRHSPGPGFCHPPFHHYFTFSLLHIFPCFLLLMNNEGRGEWVTWPTHPFNDFTGLGTAPAQAQQRKGDPFVCLVPQLSGKFKREKGREVFVWVKRLMA